MESQSEALDNIGFLDYNDERERVSIRVRVGINCVHTVMVLTNQVVVEQIVPKIDRI